MPIFLWPKQWKTRNPKDVTIPGKTRKKNDIPAANSKSRSSNVFTLNIVDTLLNRPKTIPLNNSSNDNSISVLSFEQHNGEAIVISTKIRIS